MTAKSIAGAFMLACGLTALSAQAPPPIDTSKLGPQPGQAVPPFEGVDQFGKPQTLSSISGPKGAMLVFFRSADW